MNRHSSTDSRPLRDGAPQCAKDVASDAGDPFPSEVESLTPSQLSQLARLDQKQRWSRGDRRLVEVYLERFPAILDDPELAVDLIYHEFLLREKDADPVELVGFLARFPQYASVIERQVRLHQMLEGDEVGVQNGASDHDTECAPRRCALCRTPLSEVAESAGIEQRFLACADCGLRYSPRSQDADTAWDEGRPLSMGRYDLLHPVGIGSFGTVYRARDRELDRIVAIKIPRATARLRSGELERFQREARNVARMRHPSIVPVYEIGEHQQTPFLVTEFVRGKTLADHLQNKRPTFRQAADWLATVADVVHYAHENKVIHRDLKPENIMLDEQGAPRLMDFGLARRDAGDVTMTLDGQVLGTPAYMSPEQARGEAHGVDGRTDVYSLGVILYEMLTGELPFRGTTQMMLHQVLYEEPRHPRSLDQRIPHDLETICLRAMAKETHRRFATARDLSDDLRRFLRGEPIHARPIHLLERLWLWCRRNRGIAVLSLGLLLAVLTAIGGISWKWREVEVARRDEQAARQDAVRRELEVRDGLSRLRTATELLDRGRQFLEWRRWDDADRCFGRAIDVRDDFAPSWDQRGMMYARMGLWEQAAADRARAFALQSPQSTSENWWAHAVLYAYVEDRESYRKLVQRMDEEFRGSFIAVVASDVVRAGSLLPIETSRAAAERYVHLAESARLSVPSGRTLYVAGLAQLRAGHPELTIERLTTLLQNPSPEFAHELVYPLLAMAYHRLGNANEAQAAINACERMHNQWVQFAYDRQTVTRGVQSNIDNAWPIAHMDFLEFQHYRREALALLGPPLGDDYRLHWLRGQALTSLNRRSEAAAEFTEALRLAPDDPKVQYGYHRNQAYLLVEGFDYKTAATHFAAAAKLAANESSLLRHQALCLAFAGDLPAYRQACGELLERFGSSDHQPAVHDVVEASILCSEAIADLSRLPKMAQFVESWYFDASRIRGAALFRAGQYQESLRCFEAVEKLHGLRASDWAFRAMAHHNLHEDAEAKKCLEQATQWVSAADRRAVGDLFRQTSWDDWYERPGALRLMNEASTLINQPR